MCHDLTRKKNAWNRNNDILFFLTAHRESDNVKECNAKSVEHSLNNGDMVHPQFTPLIRNALNSSKCDFMQTDTVWE